MRVTALDEMNLRGILSVAVDDKIHAGDLILSVENILVDGAENSVVMKLIFASIADKLSQSNMSAVVDKKLIQEISARVRLTSWARQSKKFYLSRDRGTLAFLGMFDYNFDELNDDERRFFSVLVKFAEFAGVGRLTAQGFGQTRFVLGAVLESEKSFLIV